MIARWREIWLGFALALHCALVPAALAATPLVVDGAPSQHFDGHLAVLEDPTGTMDLAAVRRADDANRFHSIPNGNFSFGFPAGAVWLRFSVVNPTLALQERWLSLENALLESAILHLVEADGTVTTLANGVVVPVERRPLASGRILFPLALGPGQARTGYLRVSGSMALASLMALWQPLAYAEAERRSMALKSMVIASAVTVVVLVSLFLWHHYKRLAFLAVGVADALFGIVTFMIDGAAAGWLPANDNLWQSRAIGILVMLALFFHMVFARAFLDLPRTAPRLAKGIATIATFSLVAAMVQGLVFDLKLLILYALAITSLATIIVALAAWHGIRNAGLYLLGWGTLLLVLVLVMAGAFVKAPTAVYVSILPLPSFLVASLVLAYAMYRDVRVIGEAAQRTRQNLIDFQHTEQERLAAAVESRTRELQEAKLRAEEAVKAKQTFLSTISHELRTPLHTIVGYAQLLNKGGRGEADVKLAVIENGGLQLLHLIDEMLEFIRGDTRSLALQPEVTVLARLTKQLEHTGQLLATAGGNHFVIEVADDLPAVVCVDGNRLTQVLNNLISNACKYTSKGVVTLRVEGQSGAELHGVRHVSFSVEDTGMGIAPVDRARIFEPFGRGAGSRHKPGVGLGLTIARQIVQAMGGEIVVESEIGHGSRFHFSLALPVVVEDAGLAVIAPPRIVGHAAPRRTLLIADDIVENSLFLRDLCIQWGFRVIMAGNGAEALATCRLHDMDVACVLVDQFMPVMDGWAFLRNVRSSTELEKLTVILVSAAQPDRPAGFPGDMNFDHVFLKPIRQQELARVLQRRLGIEWIYESAEESGVGLGDPALDDTQRIPPAEELAVFREMLALGRIVAIRHWAHDLKERHSAYADFAAEVTTLVDAVNLAGLKGLLARIGRDAAEMPN
ncbi:MAG TPA: ATP-binding protein [Rhodocyclaceae bacterium]|nr:ATP-binding protein [Rhodocyclaceae bacterium]